MKKKNNAYLAMLPYVVVAVVIVVALFLLNGNQNKVNDIKTGELMEAIQNNEVTEITITPKSSENVYIIEGKLKDYEENESFTTRVISEEVNTITKYAEEENIKEFKTNKDPGSSNVAYILINVLPIVILVIASYFLFTRLTTSNNKSMDFGRSRAKLSEDGGKVRFTDVAGLKEEKEEVQELIDFLKNPKNWS